MIEQAIKNTQETFQITFYKDGVATTPSSVLVDIERLSGITVVSGTTIISNATATAAQPCVYTIPSTKTTSLGQYRVLWKPVIDGETREDTQYFEIVTKRTRYCPNRSVLEAIGDVPLPDGIDLSRYINRAEATVDNALRGLYVTPVDISTSAIKQEAIDILDSITVDLAAGYLLQGLGAIQQVKSLNAYAKEMIDRAKADLERIKNQEIVLVGAVAETNTSANMAVFPKCLVSSPDGLSTAKDSKSYFNRPYDQVADPTYEIDIDI
jgi:hypothetical protein